MKFCHCAANPFLCAPFIAAKQCLQALPPGKKMKFWLFLGEWHKNS
jgi:hypothetical protein